MRLYANLKMNMDYNEIVAYKNGLASNDFVVIPSSLFISQFSDFEVGAQDVSIYKKGSYTGDISGVQLKSLGVKYCLIGHSERRKYYGEGNDVLQLKLNNLVENDIIPIVCVGENSGDDKFKILDEQLSVITNLSECIIAYEPVWAIGTGVVPTVSEIEETITYIKNKFNFSVLYGGSVDENNIDELVTIKNVDGFLVGKASCDFVKVNKMVEVIRQN